MVSKELFTKLSNVFSAEESNSKENNSEDSKNKASSGNNKTDEIDITNTHLKNRFKDIITGMLIQNPVGKREVNMKVYRNLTEDNFSELYDSFEHNEYTGPSSLPLYIALDELYESNIITETNDSKLKLQKTNLNENINSINTNTHVKNRFNNITEVHKMILYIIHTNPIADNLTIQYQMFLSKFYDNSTEQLISDKQFDALLPFEEKSHGGIFSEKIDVYISDLLSKGLIESSYSVDEDNKKFTFKTTDKYNTNKNEFAVKQIHKQHIDEIITLFGDKSSDNYMTGKELEKECIELHNESKNNTKKEQLHTVFEYFK